MLFSKKLAILLTVGALASTFPFCASADFVKQQTYTDGMFTDVAEDEWYADNVKDVYEYGLMKGDSANTFSPSGTLSVAEGITVASRIYMTLTGTEIPDVAGGEWYEKYVSYALSNGLMADDDFDNYDRELKRFEMARLLAVASESVLSDINTVGAIPDVPSNHPAYEAIKSLYEGGVLNGNDEYGNFAPVSNLQRSEMAAMTVRIADASKRVSKEFVDEPVREFTDSYYIMEVPYSGANSESARYEGVPNGWNGDNRFWLLDNSSDTERFLRMTDLNEKQFYALNRDFNEEYEGVITAELYIQAQSGDEGVYVAFQNPNEENVVTVTPEKGVWVVKGIDRSVSEVVVSENEMQWYAVTVTVDLDKNTASVKINNRDAGSVFIEDKSISRLKLGTTQEGVGSVYFNYGEMWKNRPINERFVVSGASSGENPSGWNVSGNFRLASIAGQVGSELYSLKSNTKAGETSEASVSFEKMNGPMGLEAFVLFPEITDGARVSFMSDEREVFTFETKDGKLYYGDTVVNDYLANIWQHLQVDADTETGKAIIKVNGKKRAETDFSAPYINGFSVNFSPKKDAIMWLDDICVYNLLEHEDYPSYPQVAESVDYNIGINVCWLWRDFNVREGWDSVSAFPEFEPYLGYYDEGSREAADWEIKQLVEHGIDFLHVCWYSPNASNTTPIKNQDYSFSALHDGYFNAKYSDLLDFCILWENAGQKDFSGFDAWKERIWNYWVEYYFKDDRYFRLDNKVLISVFKPQNLEKTFGSVEGVREAIEFMNEDIRKYGYDGIILISDNEWHVSYDYMNSLGFDATYAYQWGSAGSDGDYQIEQNRTFDQNAQKAGNHHIPTVSVGFNAVGRGFVRSGFVSAEDHLKVCQDIKKILATYQTGTWKDNTLIVSTLNEYSEGHYVAPTQSIGYSLLENIRKTFTRDTSDHTKADAPLTDAQKARITKMYPPQHSPIRRLMLEDISLTTDILNKDYELLDESATLSTKSGWKANHNIISLTEKDGVLSGVGNSFDYGIINAQTLSVQAEDVHVIHLRMKTDKIGKIQIFFATRESPELDGAKSLTVSVTAVDEYVDYYFLPTQNSAWTGTVTTLRLDPNTIASTFDIAAFELYGMKDRVNVYINGQVQNSAFTPSVTDDGDLEMTVEASFFTKCGLYHEFDRFTGDGVLTLYNRNNDKIVLTVGSNKVLVNGEEKNLGFTFKLRDGLPVLQIMKFIQIVGYDVRRVENDIRIQTCSDEEYEILAAYENDCYEFGLDGELMGFVGHNSVLSTEGDYIKSTALGNDQGFILKREMTLDFDVYNALTVGLRYEEDMTLNGAELFYIKKGRGDFSGQYRVGGEYVLPEDIRPGDTFEILFDLASASDMEGVLSSIRVDPFTSDKDYYIDYVRFTYDADIAFRKNAEEAEKEATYNSFKYVDDENQWEWNAKEDNTAGWVGQCTEPLQNTSDSVRFVPTADDTAAIRTVWFEASDYQIIIYSVKYNELMLRSAPELFFMNEGDGGYSASKGVKGEYIIPSDAELGDTILCKFDLRSHALWKGKIIRLRFDPYNGKEVYEIRSLRLCTAKIPEEMLIPEPTRPTELILNAGDSYPDGITVSGGNADILVADDPEDSNVKVFKVEANTRDNLYTYMNINMQFEAGATYTVSYRVYPLKDQNGETYSTHIAATLIYGTQSNRALDNHRVGHDISVTEGKGWYDIVRTVKIADDYYPQDGDKFQFWGTPENRISVSYLISDIKVVKQ